ncbi:MAG: GntR family transcriptional regulator [Eubacteriales bacterium]
MSKKYKSKSDEAYEIIKHKILSNELKDGEVISENLFAEELNISRTPVRSAFQRLVMEGFIKIYPSRGAIVQEMSLEESREIYDLRLAIETFIIKKIFNNITQEDIENLKLIIRKQEEAFNEGEAKSYIESMKYDMKFHSYFLTIYKNEKINQIFKSYMEKMTSFGYIALIKPGRMNATLEEHKKIIDCIEKKDLNSAVESLEFHLENGKSNAFR